MGRLIITEFITLDGVIDSPSGGPHPHAGWTFRHVAFDEAAYELKDREQKEAGAMLMGRVSYDEFAPVWPSMEEFAEYNAMPKYVVSSTLAKGLAAAGLVDRYHLLVFPLLLGAGRRLFDDATDALRTLELVEHEAYSNGILKTVYDVVP